MQSMTEHIYSLLTLLFRSVPVMPDTPVLFSMMYPSGAEGRVYKTGPEFP